MSAITIARTLAAAVILAGASIACSSFTEGRGTSTTKSPAESSMVAADFSGTYTVTYDDGLVRTWTATSCGHGCANVEQNSKPFDGKAQARLSGHQWTMAISTPTETDCGDGTSFPGITTWTWDESTQRGSSHTEQTVAACGDPAGDIFDEHTFSLAKS